MLTMFTTTTPEGALQITFNLDLAQKRIKFVHLLYHQNIEPTERQAIGNNVTAAEKAPRWLWLKRGEQWW